MHDLTLLDHQTTANHNPNPQTVAMCALLRIPIEATPQKGWHNWISPVPDGEILNEIEMEGCEEHARFLLSPHWNNNRSVKATKLTYGKVRWNNAGSIRRDEASGRGPAGVDKGGTMEDG